MDKVQYIDRKRGIVSKYVATFVTTAHFLSWRGSYGYDKKVTPYIPRWCCSGDI